MQNFKRRNKKCTPQLGRASEKKNTDGKDDCNGNEPNDSRLSVGFRTRRNAPLAQVLPPSEAEED